MIVMNLGIDYAIFSSSYDDILLINKWWYQKVASGLNEEGQIDRQPLFSAVYQVGLHTPLVVT
jgi:hypothetical protein